MPIQKRLVFIGFALLVIVFIGIEGYHLTEGWGFLDSVYTTVLTLSTVGFSEAHPLSRGGKALTAFLALGGLGTLFFGVSSITAFLVAGDLKDSLRRKRMDKASDLKGHYILCGLGSLGRSVVEEIKKTKHRFVLIDADPTRFRNLSRKSLLLIEGDATRRATLLSAGIHGASALITLLPHDKENLFVVLTAKELNPRLRIISKGVEEEARQTLVKAGADSVIFPNAIGGFRIASEVLRPTQATFLDAILAQREKDLQIDEMQIGPGSPLSGVTLSEARIPDRCGLVIFAIRDPQSGYRYNPQPSTLLREGDFLVAWGEEAQLQRLRSLCSAPDAFRRTA